MPRTPFLNRSLVSGFYFLTVALLLLSATASAQYTKYVDFGGKLNGIAPYGTPVYDGTFLYGTTSAGGATDNGVIYKVKPDGTSFSVLYQFDGGTGSTPVGDLLYDGTFLYGMTRTGGGNSQGAIYKIKPDGTSFTLIFSFVYATNGAFPLGALITDGNALYGMTQQGGTGFGGVVFKVNKDGTGYTKLVEFDSNQNGGGPEGSLFYDGTFLYGMTFSGGVNDLGVIFKVKTDGTGFVKLLDFAGTATGAQPRGSLISDGTFLYGMTLRGGANNVGAAFKIKPDGTGFQKIMDMSLGATGTVPKGAFAYDGTYLYGITADGGGSGNSGIIFRMLTDGSGFEKLRDIKSITSGPLPEGTPLLVGTDVVVVRSGGGGGRFGEIYKLRNNGSNQSSVHIFETDSSTPTGRPVFNGASYFGLTSAGGINNDGTIYKINPDGSGYSRVFNFEAATSGSSPASSLAFDGTYFYGMTSGGGANDNGTIFKILPTGTGYVKLFDFNGAATGVNPHGSLISDGTFLYGLAFNSGVNSAGTIFKIKLDGTGFTKLLDLDFTNTGAYPNGTLIFSLDFAFLYGLTQQGGANGGFGVAFKIKTDGTGFQKLHDFDNTNGGQPMGSPVAVGTTLYGFTSTGGANGDGTIFKVNVDGTGFATVLDLDGPVTGSAPQGSLIFSGGYLYGMTHTGGLTGNGTLFRIKPDGTGFNKYIDFNDGRQPVGSLASDGTFLYGTTSGGGLYDKGTFFKVSQAPFLKLTTVDPTHGVEGTYVTLNGQNFDPVPSANTVTFNGTPATVVSATTTSMVVVVPVGATNGKIVVTNANGTDTSVNDFVVDTQAQMYNGTVRNCNFKFVGPASNNDYIETLLPETPGDKVRVTFNVGDISDQFRIHDGPDVTSPVLADESTIGTGTVATATNAAGVLTLEFIWLDNTTIIDADVSCVSVASATINIGTQPAASTVCNGKSTTFTTAASGTTNLTYQWRYSPDGVAAFTNISNGGGYSNTTTATLTVNTAGNFGGGFYACFVSGDLAPSVLTDSARLTINPIPAAPVASASAAVCNPSSVNLSVTGAAAGQYLWYNAATGGSPITGQVNSTFATPSLSATTNYYASISIAGCESSRTAVTATIKNCNPPVIATSSAATGLGGIVTIDLTALISDPENDVDVSTLKVTSQPVSGAVATIKGQVLSINYTSVTFTGLDEVSVQVCDLTGLCATQKFSIEVVGDVIVYNAVSPNGDKANEYFRIEYIDVIPDRKQNQVKIYNRWGDEVFSVQDYNNKDKAFTGLNKNGNRLPAGVYYYTIKFANRDETLTGYLELRY